jgi:hypothetical protein
MKTYSVLELSEGDVFGDIYVTGRINSIKKIKKGYLQIDFSHWNGNITCGNPFITIIYPVHSKNNWNLNKLESENGKRILVYGNFKKDSRGNCLGRLEAKSFSEDVHPHEDFEKPIHYDSFDVLNFLN